METTRLILRPWQLSDKEDLYEYATNELVGPNAGWKPHKNIEESIDIIKMFIGEDRTYAIVLKSENKVIGGIGLYKRYPDSTLEHLNQLEIGYALNPKFWGNGFVPEAVNYLIKYCFDELGMDLVWCGHYDFNQKSKRVNEKCGFKYKLKKEETLALLDYKKVTTLYYNILKADYEAGALL